MPLIFLTSEPSGLSLCTQGTQLVSPDFDPFARFIPVYTGNAREPEFSRSVLSVYPCVYRERSPIVVCCYLYCGLSLCIQGTQQ